jgi:general secretion pathway protein F
VSSVETCVKSRPTTPSASEDLILFHRTLAEMCRANVPLPRALRLLSHDLSRGPLRDASERMARDLEAGNSLTEAYANQRDQLPTLYRALIRVGIASGDLPSVLDEIARHAGERAQIASRLKKALFYPIVSLVTVVAIGLTMFLIVGPGLPDVRWREMFWTTMGRSGRSSWWDYAPWFVLAFFALLVLSTLLFIWFRGPLDAGAGPRGVLFKIPLVGRMRTYAAKAGFASTMAMLIRRRLPLGESLDLAAAATDHPEIAGQIAVMRACAESGESLTDSVRAGDLISPAMLWLIESGEASGTVATSLADVGRVYQQRFERSADRLCFFVNPAALVLIGLIVAGFCVACLGPMYRSVSMFWGF